jgi:iron complex transport system ATP-binding protein
MRILDRVSLSLARGEHTAILGPNGSGKSTLVKLISGQIYPSAPPALEPPIRVFGRERWNLEELRSRLGLVSADVHHRFMSGSSMGRATAMELVLASFFGAGRIFLHHEVTGEQRSLAREALARVDASGVADRRLSEMSTGEARRVLIARALVHRPEVLVLDEPTTGLDLVARRDFLGTLRRLATEAATLILVTHHVEEIVPEVKRVVLMRGGRIAADGARVEPVRRNGRYELRFEDA